MAQFFISCALDGETVLAQEIRNVWPYLLGKDLQVHQLPVPELKIVEGGVELECDYLAGIQFNYFLKTANRIMLRLLSFTARDLPKFYNKVLGFNWDEYLSSGQEVHLKVAASESRLNNEKRLQESFTAALEQKKIHIASEKPVVESNLAVSIYVRVHQDVCTVSLDTSGEHLHKRGWMPFRGEAPLRETLAARMLWELQAISSVGDVLFDPMMGSGTLLLEARSQGHGNFRRHYSFLLFKKTPKVLRSELFCLNYRQAPVQRYSRLIGQDIDEKMVSVVQKNYEKLESILKETEKKSFQSIALDVSSGDSLAKPRNVNIPKDCIIVCNPPYGERLEQASKNLTGLFEGFAGYEPKIISVLYPTRGGGFRIPEGYRLHSEIPLNNGGIRCLFTILTRV